MSEKAIIFDIQRASFHDGPGIRTTVFFKGCALNCQWCHNREGIQHQPQFYFREQSCMMCGKCVEICTEKVHNLFEGKHIVKYDDCTLCGKCVEVCNYNGLKIVGKDMSIDEIMQEVLADVDFYKNSEGGITLTGGEPLFNFQFAFDLLKECHEKHINTCVETSGFIDSARFGRILGLIDILLFDYKMTDSAAHKATTGVSNERILANLDLAYKAGVSIVLRCPIIPGVNDTKGHFAGIREMDLKYPLLQGIEIMPYHDLGISKAISVGFKGDIPEFKVATQNMKDKWIKHLNNLGCTKVKIS